ncbi:hypothetical protein PHMEG_0008624 [Phytophthora megakarya]|uniref:Uncharacterized protein n=1 Tax=Phytophthora megakarya TaxID=4795 RepID=A0A225WJ21_9STRA|nr:hypothetical protein PHMEG_0008624 [Phytophthora megakarya]
MTPMKEGERRGLVSTIRDVAVKKARQISFVRQSVELAPFACLQIETKLRLDNVLRLAIYRLRSVENFYFFWRLDSMSTMSSSCLCGDYLTFLSNTDLKKALF